MSRMLWREHDMFILMYKCDMLSYITTLLNYDNEIFMALQ